MATPSDGIQSRLGQIVQKYDELNGLLKSFDCQLVIDGARDLDVANLHGECLFTLDTLNESDY